MNSAPVSNSVASALLFSSDTDTANQIIDSLRQFAITVEVYAEASAALQVLNERKFEAVIVDFRLGLEAEVVLRKAHLSPSNRTAVTFAIGNKDEIAIAREAGTGFVFERPITPESINRTIRAAYGLIIRERRRYFRYPIVIPVTLLLGSSEIDCRTVNISEGGVSLTMPNPLKPGAGTRIKFNLPGVESHFEVDATVCWYKEPDRAGLHFVSLPPSQLSELQTWLSSRIEESLPESVIDKFRPT
jgi:response regulator RpfG family c-di-GMP phosphodiesterase